MTCGIETAHQFAVVIRGGCCEPSGLSARLAAALFLPVRPGAEPPLQSTPRQFQRAARPPRRAGPGGGIMRAARPLWTYPVISLILLMLAALTAYAAVNVAVRWTWARLRGRPFDLRDAWRRLDETSASGGPLDE